MGVHADGVLIVISYPAKTGHSPAILPPTKGVFDRNRRISTKKVGRQEREDCNKEDGFLIESQVFEGKGRLLYRKETNNFS